MTRTLLPPAFGIWVRIPPLPGPFPFAAVTDTGRSLTCPYRGGPDGLQDCARGLAGHAGDRAAGFCFNRHPIWSCGAACRWRHPAVCQFYL